MLDTLIVEYFKHTAWNFMFYIYIDVTTSKDSIGVLEIVEYNKYSQFICITFNSFIETILSNIYFE